MKLTVPSGALRQGIRIRDQTDREPERKKTPPFTKDKVECLNLGHSIVLDNALGRLPEAIRVEAVCAGSLALEIAGFEIGSSVVLVLGMGVTFRLGFRGGTMIEVGNVGVLERGSSSHNGKCECVQVWECWDRR